MDLALNFFQNELKNIYRRSMLHAGFSVQEVNESNPAYGTFAFLAWKQESERLQSIMSTDQTIITVNNDDSLLSVGAGVCQPQGGRGAGVSQEEELELGNHLGDDCRQVLR